MKKLSISILFALGLSNAATYNVLIDKNHSKYGVSEVSVPVEPVVRSSCKEIIDNGESIGDGNYTIENNSNTFDVYCDMTTDGGGWTLVISNSTGENSWNQFSSEQSGTPLQEGYRSSINILNMSYTDILWYDHPSGEWTGFQQREDIAYELNQVLPYEDVNYTYKAVSGVMRTSDSYYSLMRCQNWTALASPILMLTGSDEFGNDFGGANTGKLCDNWENDLSSWYYRFDAGSYSGSPWRENGHYQGVLGYRLQSFFIR